MIIVSYRVDDDQVQRYFDYAGYRARNMKEPFTVILSHIRHVANMAFATEGISLGGWSPLTPKYAAWKEKNYPGRPMLQLKPGSPLYHEAISAGRTTGHSLEYHPTVYNSQGFDYAEPIFMGRTGGSSKHDRPMAGRRWIEEEQELRDIIEAVFLDWLDDVRDKNRVRRTNAFPRPDAPGGFIA